MHRSTLPLLLLLAPLASTQTSLTSIEKGAPDSPPALAVAGGIRARLTEVLVSEPGDGRVWVRGRDYRASFGLEGSTYLPVFGVAAPHEFPVRFALNRARAGEVDLAVGALAVERRDDSVAIVHPSLTEVHRLELDAVEQTFVFDTLPSAGELVVELEIATELAIVTVDGRLTFVHPTLGRVEYGEALAYDARGATVAVERVWTGAGIELRVPATFVAEARLPLTIDPRLTTFSNNFGASDDSAPDICWDGGTREYWVVWSEYTSATNRDVYITSFTSAGAQGSAFVVEGTNADWEAPRVAYHHASHRLLVVASDTTVGSSAVKGQIVDTTLRVASGPALTISTSGPRKRDADVGGDARHSIEAGSHFCVVWSREYSQFDYEVEYRIVDWDGSFVTPIVAVDTTFDDTRGTTISKSQGWHGPGLDSWTIAWVNDIDHDGLGSIRARRIASTGQDNLTAPQFVVEPATDCAAPSVTSRLEYTLVAVADRPSIVSYERESMGKRSLHARVIVDGRAFSPNALSDVLEGVDPNLDRRGSRITAGRRAFYLAYSEPFHGSPTGPDRDVYYMSGSISETSDDVFIGLCERHVNLAFSGTPETMPALATRCDGEPSPFLDEGAVVWRDGGGATGGLIEGAVVDSPLDQNQPRRAAGRQFCDANPNSRTSPYSATVSSWMWLYGSQGTAATHTAFCQDVPANATGYLLASRTAGDLNLAGGSQGRLCVLGAGRYVNLVQSSGAAGTFATDISALSYPTPMGFVHGLPGETWHFQYWHRDSVAGTATSNFSNACSMMLSP